MQLCCFDVVMFHYDQLNTMTLANIFHQVCLESLINE